MNVTDLRKYEQFLESRKRIPEKYVKTENTRDHYPIYFPCHLFDRPCEDWTGSDFIRLVTFEITGMYTFHAQENVIVLQEYINQLLLPHNGVAFSNSSWANSNANFKRGNDRPFTYPFEPKFNPTKDGFLLKLDDYFKG